MSLEQGKDDAIRHIVYGVVYTAIINVIIASKLIPPSYTIYFGLANALIMVILIFTLGTRGTVYLIGWLVGVGLLIYGGILGTGLISIWELAIDLGIPMGFIGLKVYIWYKSEY